MRAGKDLTRALYACGKVRSRKYLFCLADCKSEKMLVVLPVCEA